MFSGDTVWNWGRIQTKRYQTKRKLQEPFFKTENLFERKAIRKCTKTLSSTFHASVCTNYLANIAVPQPSISVTCSLVPQMAETQLQSTQEKKQQDAKTQSTHKCGSVGWRKHPGNAIEWQQNQTPSVPLCFRPLASDSFRTHFGVARMLRRSSDLAPSLGSPLSFCAFCTIFFFVCVCFPHAWKVFAPFRVFMHVSVCVDVWLGFLPFLVLSF